MHMSWAATSAEGHLSGRISRVRIDQISQHMRVGSNDQLGVSA
jgi:hypothetical protein